MNRIYLLSLWFYKRKVSLNLFSKPSKEFRVFFTLITKSKLLRPKKFHVSLALASAYFSSSISSFSYSSPASSLPRKHSLVFVFAVPSIWNALPRSVYRAQPMQEAAFWHSFWWSLPPGIHVLVESLPLCMSWTWWLASTELSRLDLRNGNRDGMSHRD